VGYGFDRSIYWIVTVISTVIHFTNLQHTHTRNLFSGSVSLHFLLKLSSCAPLLVSVLTVRRLSLLDSLTVPICLHLLKTIFRQPSREHLVEGLGLSVVTKTTPPLCRKRLSIYALWHERVYNCHPDNDVYSALIVAVV
jgi:hypothetical protein